MPEGKARGRLRKESRAFCKKAENGGYKFQGRMNLRQMVELLLKGKIKLGRLLLRDPAFSISGGNGLFCYLFFDPQL